jgi:hypothetical protein
VTLRPILLWLSLLSLPLLLGGCANCFIDAAPQQLYSEPGLALDCDPRVSQ